MSGARCPGIGVVPVHFFASGMGSYVDQIMLPADQPVNQLTETAGRNMQNLPNWDGGQRFVGN